MWLKIAKWWATSNATNIVLIAFLGAGLGGVWYIKSLQIKAARCEVSEQQQATIEELAEGLARKYAKEAAEPIRELSQALGCAVEPAPPYLTGQLRDGAD